MAHDPFTPDYRADTRHLVKRLLREYVGKHRGKIGLAAICMVLAAATTAAHAYIMEPMLDHIFVNKDTDMLLVIPMAIAAIALVSGLANYGQNVLMKFVGQRVIADMQLDLFGHLMKADLKTFHDQAAGRLISRFTNDITMMRHSISSVLTGIAKEALTGVFLVGVMFYMSWELSIIGLFVFPLAFWPVVKLGKRMRKVADGTQQQLGEFTAQLDETFQGARVVKAYTREEFEVGRANRAIEGLFALYYKAARIQSIASPMMETLGGIAIASVVWYGGYQVLEGEATPGEFFAFITAMIMAYRPIKAIAGLNTQLQEGLSAANRLFHVLDLQATIQDAEHATRLVLDEPSVTFEDVSFSYEGDSGGVNHIDFTIQPGQTVALVGPSGGGKSTILNLLLRFYEIESGSICVSGQDIRSVTQKSLREQLSLVSQEVVLFDDTIRANIAYGKLDASEEDVLQAAKNADAHDFIMELPQGYDTPIGPHGVKLSGGQRQRISIARAMLKNAPILLLDEATSALDTQSEKAVQSALNHLMEGRTTLVIAHRLSTVQHADNILVMQYGRIIEQGTHKELLRHEGVYHHLYTSQFSKSEAA